MHSNQCPGRDSSDIKPDGSNRRFRRMTFKGRKAISISPPEDAPNGIAEARSFYNIGKHLLAKRIPAPEIFAFNHETGEIVVEDLGDTLLYHLVTDLLARDKYHEVKRLYQRALHLLCLMQKHGTEDFYTGWCFDTPLYDSRFAWDREARYFMDSFLRGRCAISPDKKIESELDWLCGLVDSLMESPCFMHRDFQSRNIMIQGGELRVIDFQGARLGPWGYDAASLIHDPYVDLPGAMREELLTYYLERMQSHGISGKGPNSSGIDQRLYSLNVAALLRTLQALAAYAYLSGTLGKSFFASFFEPALKNLRNLLDLEQFSSLDALRDLAGQLYIP